MTSSKTLSRRLSPVVTVERQEDGGLQASQSMSTAIVMPAESSNNIMKVDLDHQGQVAELIGGTPTCIDYDSGITTWVQEGSECEIDAEGECITQVPYNCAASSEVGLYSDSIVHIHGTVVVTGNDFSELPEHVMTEFDHAQEVTYEEALSVVQSRGIHY